MRYQTTARRSREQIERDRVSAERHLEGYLLMFNIAQEKDMESGQTAEHATADQVIAAVRRDDRKAARAGMSTITQLEWRGPAGFVPPELGT